MYGMINRFFQELIEDRFGKDKWLEIARKAQLEDVYFMGMKQYPDKVSYDIIAAAVEVLEIPAEKILYVAGENWINFILTTEFSYVYKVFGENLFEFLKNLDNLHLNVSNVMPELTPPSFKSTDITDKSLHLHYYSDRPGLSPFVEGLIIGLAKHFKQQVKVTQIDFKSEQKDHDIYLVELVGD